MNNIIERNSYLQKLIAKKENGLIKIITGIRRSGKSFLLFNIYKNYLNSLGIDDARIITIALDKKQYENLRNPNELYSYIQARINNDNEKYYVFIDEIQLSYKVKRDVDESIVASDDKDLIYTTFYDVLNDFMSRPNVDIYVTGSNSKMLSKDVATNFRDRGTEIRVYPLSFEEFYKYRRIEKSDAWNEYITFGGMPLAVLESDEKEKVSYLKSLFERLYLFDIKERYKLKDTYVLDNLINIVFSSVGSLTNPHKLVSTLASVLNIKSSDPTIKLYLDYLQDAFILSKAERYDVKGKRYLDYPAKYYAVDAGLRNAKLNFRQQEKTHLMENILYNELLIRGYSVDVGMVEISVDDGNKIQTRQHEIDFIVNTGTTKIYIQSAFSIENEQKKQTEILPLIKTDDFFRKIVVTDGNEKLWTDEKGISYVGIIQFLLNKDI